jgi:hydrogenase small subunit
VSLLDLVSTDPNTDPNVDAPQSAAALLTGSIDLVYHPVLMSAAGQTASDAALQAAASGPYILVVEGGVPTAFSGKCGIAWSRNGEDVTFQDALTQLAKNAKVVVAVGACASFGGVSASGFNLAGVIPVSKAITNPVVNVPGCPAHPYWIVWTLVQVLGTSWTMPALDSYGRPRFLYGKEVHANCPRNDSSIAHAANFGIDNQCLIKLGCAGPGTYSPCPTMKWNNGVNWCVDANSPCLGCTEPTFPDLADFYNVANGT